MDVFLTGFPKRLLIATSVAIIIAMCLNPAEARSVEHKRRHQMRQPETVALLITKDMSASMKSPKNPSTELHKSATRQTNHKRRHQRRQPENPALLITKDTSVSMKAQKNPSVELYKNATRKITKKLRNTKRFFDQERRILNETREYRDGMPDWLPTVNFVDIHFHDYKTSRKVGASITERKFTYLMPKLYKSLNEYQVIFKRLNNVQVEFPDDQFNSYRVIRQKLIEDTLKRLYSTIAEISENMYTVNMTIPPFDESRMKLDSLAMKVDATQCLKNDYITFRGYGNLLNNWYFEFRCLRNKKNTRNCKDFETKLDIKRENRRQKFNKSNPSLSS